MTEREEYYYNTGYNNATLQECNAPITILEYLYYELGKLEGITDYLEMSDNSILYNTDVYSTEHNKIEQLIKDFETKKGDE